MSAARVNGREVPAGLIAPLRDSSSLRRDDAAVQERMREDGYVFLRSAVEPAAALEVWREVTARLAAVDEIEAPAADGIFSERSRRRELASDLGAFWKSISELPALRRVTHGPELRELLSRIMGEPATPHDYLFLRVATPGKATELHFDRPFFCRGSERVHTVWIALGEIPLDRGPLVVVEGSHRFDDLIEPMRRIDYDSKASPRVAAREDAITLAQTRGARLLTEHFQPGDAIVFSMTLMHGALDHYNPERRVRLSCDIRFQPEADERDPRYFGSNPGGTTGAGYGELNGAKPLTDSWHVR